MTLNNEKVTVHILYPCYICAEEYGNPNEVINHVENYHGYILEPCRVDVRHPDEDHYAFEYNVKTKWDVQHFGCPSCWFHCPMNFETLMEHIMEEHKPARIEGFVNVNQDEDEFEDDVQQQNGEEERAKAEIGEAIVQTISDLRDIFKSL